MEIYGTFMKELADTYPQLYLDPDREETEAFRAVVLRGLTPEKKDLSHFKGDPEDRMETVDTPAGPVTVITLGLRRDFEIFIRCMTAAKEGARVSVPETMGASTLFTFNWQRIHAHRARFLEEEKTKGNLTPDWNKEFALFRQDKKNYIDMLIVLSRGPYSNIPAEKTGLGENEWLDRSYTIRKYHECTHFICRTLYPDRIDAVFDELLADAVGLYAAFGRFDPETEKLFLGIRDGRYAGGRLENYVSIKKTEDPEAFRKEMDAVSERCCGILDGLAARIGAAEIKDPFALIPLIMENE